MAYKSYAGGWVFANAPGRMNSFYPSANATASTFIPGNVVKRSADQTMALTTAVTDTMSGVVISSPYKDRYNFIQTTDLMVQVAYPGSTVYVLSESGAAWTCGGADIVYMAQTSDDDGHCDDSSSNSATIIGYYLYDKFGQAKDRTTTDEELIGALLVGAI
jgi:hypothetical protein